MTAYDNITAVLDRIEKVSSKGLNYAIELEDIEQLQKAQEQVKNNGVLPDVKHRLCLNCKHCVPNTRTKYWHDRYFCQADEHYNNRTITSPENYNCNLHEFNGA